MIRKTNLQLFFLFDVKCFGNQEISYTIELTTSYTVSMKLFSVLLKIKIPTKKTITVIKNV